MKLIFYGTTGALQTIDNANTSFAVIKGESIVLVDTSGNPFQYLLKTGSGGSDFDALILTHAHSDHLYALPSLIQNLILVNRKKPLYIICNGYTEKKAKQLLDIFSLLSRKGMFPIEWISREDMEFDRTPDLRITLFPVNHPVQTSGFKITTSISSMVYSSDTVPSERVVSEAAGANVLIHESTGSDRNKRELNEDGHSTAGQAGEAAERAGVETLFLCHFDLNRCPPPDELLREAKKAFKGKVIIPKPYKIYDV